MSHLYFRNTDGWARHTSRAELATLAPGLLADLISQPAVDHVVVRNDRGGMDVLSKRGEARFNLRGETITYEVSGGDPFGYGALPHTFDRERLLGETMMTDYPDAPYQLAKLFTAARTGDVVVSAALGYDLRLRYENPEHHGSHGSLHASHMLVPVLCNRKLRSDGMRTTDVFPTIMTSLGLEIPRYAEGQPLT